VKVIGDSLGYHGRFENGGGIIHHRQISFQFGSAIITITAMSKFDPAAIG
jgi:hypothetical protein